MGKNFCKVEKKWCKFLKRGVCEETKTDLSQVNRCPKLAKIETKRLSDLLKEVAFNSVFYTLCTYFKDQEKNRDAYEKVFYNLSLMNPKKHKLSDLFIMVTTVIEGNSRWLDISGVDVTKRSPVRYGLEFVPWRDWISMFITQDTLDKLSSEEIVAGCLYEMTFFGFEEEDIAEQLNSMNNSIKDAKV